MRSEPRAALVVIGVSRALSHAVAFAVIAALLHAVASGRDPLPLFPAAVGLFGVALVLVSVMRERGSLGQSSLLAVVVIAGSAAWALSLPARSTDVLAVLTRVLGAAVAGEAFLWRLLGVSRGLNRWREVRGDAFLALALLVLAALVPGPLDREALPLLGLAVAVLGAAALSLARSTEELTLSAAHVQGRTTSSAATGTAFAIGVLALLTAVLLPAAQELLARAGRVIGPVIGDILFIVLLPIGYLAAYLVYLVQWLRDVLRPGPLLIEPPRLPFDPALDAERLRELEAARPFVFGALEIVVALVALVLALVLVARLVQERRARLAQGVVLEREAVEGIGLGATLRSLFPGRQRRLGPPQDDGTRSAALRRIYWRLLELADREGPGRRAVAETPAEHERRLLTSGSGWGSASRIVRAFESLRYGESEPDEATVAEARGALRALEGGRAAEA